MTINVLIGNALVYAREHGGVSVDMSAMRIVSPQDYWMFPKYPSRTRIIPSSEDILAHTLAFIATYAGQLHEPDCMLGIWLNPKTQEYYIDITTSVNGREEAIRAAKVISRKEGRTIVAIYNPLRDETLFL